MRRFVFDGLAHAALHRACIDENLSCVGVERAENPAGLPVLFNLDDAQQRRHLFHALGLCPARRADKLLVPVRLIEDGDGVIAARAVRHVGLPRADEL